MSNNLQSSIIIPVWNQWEYTNNCINALLKTVSPESTEIIVVDNGSSDKTIQELQKFSAKFNYFKIIRNQQNLGFAKACNQGGHSASGEYLIFLNNDTVPNQRWLENLIEAVKIDPAIGGAGSLLLYPNGTIQHAGMGLLHHQMIATDSKIMGPLSLPYHLWKGEQPAATIKHGYQIVPALTGACLLIPKKYFIEIGGFDENFKNGFEDIDLCFRLRSKGLKMLFCPFSVLTHFESVTPNRYEREKQNLIYFLQKWAHYLNGTPDAALKAHLQNVSSSSSFWIDISGIYFNQSDPRKKISALLKQVKEKTTPVIWDAYPLPNLKITVKLFFVKATFILPFAKGHGFYTVPLNNAKNFTFNKKFQYFSFFSIQISRTGEIQEDFTTKFLRKIFFFPLKFLNKRKPLQIPQEEKLFILGSS
jgi:GT2 family glycosyltransferase